MTAEGTRECIARKLEYLRQKDRPLTELWEAEYGTEGAISLRKKLSG